MKRGSAAQDLARACFRAGGRAAAAALAAAMESRLAPFLKEVPDREVCLAAAGGLGRGELFPGSDLDFILLEKIKGAADATSRALVGRLWDLGVKVNISTRTVAEYLELAGRDGRVFTELLDLRFLAGDPELFQGWRREAARFVRRRRRTWRAQLLQQRHRREAEVYGYFPPLEPDLKQGPGGLRDQQQRRWVQKLGFRPHLKIEEETEKRWHEAVDLLFSARYALRLQGASDQLRLELRPAVLTLLAPGRGEKAKQEVLCRLFAALETVRDQSLETILAAFPGRKRQPATLSLSSFLCRGLEGRSDWLSGVAGDRLQAWLPETAATRHLALADPWHRYPVGSHGRIAAELARRICRGQWPALPRWLAEIVGRIAQPQIFVLAALLHDAGKGRGRQHERSGAQLARSAARRLKLSRRQAETLEFLVREHLLFGQGSRRLDLDDPVLMQRLAQRVGTVERLETLLLLTYVDFLASHPEAWNRWREGLIRDLYLRLRNLLAEEGQQASIAALLRRRRRELAQGRRGGSLARFLETMPRSYLLSGHSAAAAEHARLLEQAHGRGLALHFERAQAGLADLVVCAPDRLGLLAVLCGTISLLRLNILSSQVFSSDDGWALDFFQVAVPEEVDSGAVVAELSRLLPQALNGALDLSQRLVQRRRRSAPPPTALRARREVTFDPRGSRRFTVVEVYAPDRVGLLHDVAEVFSDCGVDLCLAKVDTRGEEAADVFFVRGAEGGKIPRRQLAGLRRRLLAALNR